MRAATRFGFRFLSVPAVLASFLSADAWAAETALTAPGAPEALVNRLTAASLTMNAEAQGIEGEQEIVAAALSDYGTLVGVLYDQGYFGPVVQIRIDGREAADIPPLNPPSNITKIEIIVDTGPKFVFGTTEVAPLAPETELPETFATGQPASTSAIRDAAVESVSSWRDAGHAKADVTGQDIRVDHRSSELNARLTVTPGPQLRFGKATVTGNVDVRTDAILRIAGFPTGEIYDPEDIRTVRSRLQRTGSFRSVAIREADTANPDDTLDFEIITAERLKRRITFGAEVSSTEGLDLTARWMHRNLFGGAERLRIEAGVGNIGGSEAIDWILGARLERPARFGADYDQFFIAEIQRLNEPNYSTTRAEIGGGVRRIFNEDLFGEVGISLSTASVDDVFGSDRPFNFLMFPSRIEWDKRDDKVSATSGYYLDTRATPFFGLNGTEAGMQAVLDGRGYIGFGANDTVVLAGRIQLGTVFGPQLSDISPDFLFYSGGAGTVRGQPYQTLGVPIGNGTAGGRSFLGLSAEIRTKVTRAISIVGFYDYGAVDSDSFIDKASASHSGAGLGVRYDIAGIGPLRLDLAVPVTGDNDGDGLQFYLGIGQAF